LPELFAETAEIAESKVCGNYSDMARFHRSCNIILLKFDVVGEGRLSLHSKCSGSVDKFYNLIDGL